MGRSRGARACLLSLLFFVWEAGHVATIPNVFLVCLRVCLIFSKFRLLRESRALFATVSQGGYVPLVISSLHTVSNSYTKYQVDLSFSNMEYKCSGGRGLGFCGAAERLAFVAASSLARRDLASYYWSAVTFWFYCKHAGSERATFGRPPFAVRPSFSDTAFQG